MTPEEIRAEQERFMREILVNTDEYINWEEDSKERKDWLRKG